MGLLHAGRVRLLACVVKWLSNGWCVLDVLRTGWCVLDVFNRRCLIGGVIGDPVHYVAYGLVDTTFFTWNYVE